MQGGEDGDCGGDDGGGGGETRYLSKIVPIYTDYHHKNVNTELLRCSTNNDNRHISNYIVKFKMDSRDQDIHSLTC